MTTAFNEHEYLIKFASTLNFEEGRNSCLVAALRDARRITGRNIDTGERENYFLGADKVVLSPYSPIGLVNYLLILDMIGNIFTAKGKELDEVKNKIYSALFCFSNLSEEEIHVVLALRNSLAHNYGLANKKEKKNGKLDQRQTHKFILDNTTQAPLICFPKVPWDGQFSTKTEDQSTTVGTIALMNLVEEVYHTLLTKLEKGTATLNLAGGIEELNSRFTVLY